jgi:hypothetical protein
MTEIKRVALSLVIWMAAAPAFTGSLVEREGAYEINWSSGKIRFYGVAKLKDGEKNLRGAEQRAWADGLTNAEKNIPLIMSSRLGDAAKPQEHRLTGLARSTTSVSTTYFGDDRIKVILQAPLATVIPQLLAGETDFSSSKEAPIGFVLNVSGPAQPSAVLQVVDENGQTLAKVPAPRWFKGKTRASELGVAADAPVISGALIGKGRLKVSSSQWQPGFEAALVSGKAAVVVQ